MATNPDDWGLPPIVAPVVPLVLTQGELLLVDWIICGASHLLLDTDLGDLVAKWEPLRLRCWQAIGTNLASCPLEMDTSEAHVVLAICPTTFRWGVGDDVGFSLKLKLAKYLAPEMFPHDDKDAAQGDAQAPSATANAA